MTSVGTAAEWLMIFYRASLTSDLTDFLLVTFHYEANDHFLLYFLAIFQILQCFDAVGWAAGRASGL